MTVSVFGAVTVAVLVFTVTMQEQAELILLAAKADNAGGTALFSTSCSFSSRFWYTVEVAAVTVTRLVTC